MDLNEKEGTHDDPDQTHQIKYDSADSDVNGDEIASEVSYGDDDDDYYIDYDEDDDDDDYGYDMSVTDSYDKRVEHSESSSYGGHQSTTSFWQRYRCCSTSSHERVESSDKVILPASALDVLTSLKIDYPMLFEFQPYYFDADETQSVRASHCGVWEFTAEEGFVYMPNWMMENMHLREGDLVLLQNKALPKGTHVKLQPHRMDFLDIPDPKAMLEAALATFSCLTTGDTIVLPYENKYYMDIIETKPSDAIGITDTDCEVDFAPPLDYKEPEKPVAASIPLNKEEAAADVEEPKFSAFMGTGNRLDGKPLQYEPALDSSSFVAANGNAQPCTGSSSQGTSRRAQGKLIFGTDATPTSTAAKVASKEAKQQQQLQQKEKPKFLAFTGKTYSLT